jgi:peptidoglycan hydrolase CwlO-like protein
MAVRERIQATEKLGVVEKLYKSSETEKNELQARVRSLGEQSQSQQKEIAEQAEMIARLQRELNSAREENRLLKDENSKR